MRMRVLAGLTLFALGGCREPEPSDVRVHQLPQAPIAVDRDHPAPRSLGITLLRAGAAWPEQRQDALPVGGGEALEAHVRRQHGGRPYQLRCARMRAIRIREPGGPEVLELVDLAAPPLPPQHVRVRVRWAALNRADLLQRLGIYPAPPGSPPAAPISCGCWWLCLINDRFLHLECGGLTPLWISELFLIHNPRVCPTTAENPKRCQATALQKCAAD